MKTNAIGLIFASVGDGLLGGMTAERCMASVPFGGRYRMIDFPLSAMVHAGIVKVGIPTRSNYRSLMDHLGSGKPWDLSRKAGGIYLFPPFSNLEGSNNATRLRALAALLPFLENSREDYVVCCDCDTVLNFDFGELLHRHVERGSDVTFGYTLGALPHSADGRMVLQLDENETVRDILVQSERPGECACACGVTVWGRAMLVQTVRDAISHNYATVDRDVYQRQLGRLTMHGYRMPGYVRVIDSLASYLAANCDLLQSEVRTALFSRERPVFTKVRDDAPARYLLTGEAQGSLIADGCEIAGRVENCVLFRGVRVGRGAVLQNCVAMQDTVIGENASLTCVITDKNAEIAPGRTLAGFEAYPSYIAKGAFV